MIWRPRIRLRREIENLAAKKLCPSIDSIKRETDIDIHARFLLDLEIGFGSV